MRAKPRETDGSLQNKQRAYLYAAEKRAHNKVSGAGCR